MGVVMSDQAESVAQDPSGDEPVGVEGLPGVGGVDPGRWRMRWPAKVFVAVMIGLVVLMVCGFCGMTVWVWGEKECLWSSEPQLGPLVSDPLADKELLGLTSIRSSEREGSNIDNFLAPGPSCQTTVKRTFGASVEGAGATVDRIVEFAEDNGWIITEESRPSYPMVYLDKPYDDDRAKSVIVSGHDSGDSGHSVTLTLIWGSADFWSESVPAEW
jgi:hypothetical protein